MFTSSASEIDSAEARASERRSVSATRRRRYADRLSLALVAIYALAIVNCDNFFLKGGGQLQFIDPGLNYFFLNVVVLIPVILLGIRASVPYTPSKWWVVAALSCVVFYLTIGGSFFLSRRIVPLQPVVLNREFIRSFRISGFDTDIAAVQQERDILPGLIWTVSLHREYFAQDVRMKAIDRCHLRCDFFKRRLPDSAPFRTVFLQIR